MGRYPLALVMCSVQVTVTEGLGEMYQALVTVTCDGLITKGVGRNPLALVM